MTEFAYLQLEVALLALSWFRSPGVGLEWGRQMEGDGEGEGGFFISETELLEALFGRCFWWHDEGTSRPIGSRRQLFLTDKGHGVLQAGDVDLAKVEQSCQTKGFKKLSKSSPCQFCRVQKLHFQTHKMAKRDLSMMMPCAQVGFSAIAPSS